MIIQIRCGTNPPQRVLCWARLMFEHSRDRFFIADTANSFSQHTGERQSTHFIQRFNFWCQRNGIADDKFINDRVFDVLDSVAGEIGCVA